MSELSEKIGQLTAKADAAHTRIDKLEFLLREDLKGIKDDLKALNATIHHGRGWMAGALFIATIVGAGIAKLIPIVFK